MWDLFVAVGAGIGVVTPLLLFGLALLAAWLEGVARWLARLLMAGLALGSLTVALVLTMRPATGGVGVRQPIQWNPWLTLEVVATGRGDSYVPRMEALGNVLLLMPLGCALVFLVGRWAAALLTSAVAVALEATQWLVATGRQPDTADVLLNVTGGALGVLLALAAVALVAAAGGGAVGQPPSPAA